MIATEASADRHAAKVVKELKTKLPDCEIFGMGGPQMAAAGMECIYSMDELAVMGFTDVLPKLGHILKIRKNLKMIMAERKPDIFIPTDSPDFNMHLARHAGKLGIKVLYYIAPQAWAWRSSRARKLAKIVDGLAVIFPFEEQFFASYGVNVRYVGHPILEHAPRLSQIVSPPRRIAILPGSRRHEIEMMLDDMLAAKELLDCRHEGLQWFLPLAPGVSRNDLPELPANIQLVDELPDVDLAICKSGTSTFELALRGIPEVICYRTSRLNYLLAKLFVKTKNIGMPNIILGRDEVPELIQNDLNALDLADAVTAYIQDSHRYMRTRVAFKEMRETLGAKRAAEGVTNWAIQMLNSTNAS